MGKVLADALHSGEVTMGKKLDVDQITAYARDQIQAARGIQQRHRPGIFPGVCHCGRPEPCSVLLVCRDTITHYSAKLAILVATLPLPVISPGIQPDNMRCGTTRPVTLPPDASAIDQSH